MIPPELAPWVTLATLLVTFYYLIKGSSSPDLIFLGALVFLAMLDIISVEEALRGFANPTVLTIAALFVVAAGMRATGALELAGRYILSSSNSSTGVLRKLAFPVVTLSSVMNNTPIVAMLVPTLIEWCHARNISPSRVLLFVSYLAILGGTCTLIGTSTNLVVNGQMINEGQRIDSPYSIEFKEQLSGFGFVELAWVGIPCALLGSIYIIFFGRRMLPKRADMIKSLGEKRREYFVEMEVQSNCHLIGQTVEEAGLRHLPGLFLIEISRGEDEIISPVTPVDKIYAGDHLVFTGVISTIIDLEKIPGLVPAADLSYEVNPKARSRRHLSEAVLSISSPLVGKTIRKANFRQLYNAAVVAVHRNGERLSRKIGDIKLAAGDTLLLQTRTHFEESYRNSKDFYLVSSVEGTQPGRTDKAWIAYTLLGFMVTIMLISNWLPEASTWSSPVMPCIAVAAMMVLTRCLPLSDARNAVDLQVLITIAASIGLGQALQTSGAMEMISKGIVGELGIENPYILLVAIYLLTVVFTETASNSAVAAVMPFLAISIAYQSNLNPRPFLVAITIAASSSFVTPIGYQTNLMVMGPGGYRPSDYLRAGLPLSIIVAITSMVVIPLVWPFEL